MEHGPCREHRHSRRRGSRRRLPKDKFDEQHRRERRCKPKKGNTQWSDVVDDENANNHTHVRQLARDPIVKAKRKADDRKQAEKVSKHENILWRKDYTN